MLRPLALCLLLVCAASLTSSAVVTENGLPILWLQSSGQLTDLPIQDGVLTPDPWQYLQRMSLYRLIVAATDPFMGSMGTNATDSPIWGLPLQLGWMQTSGRLVDPTGATTCGMQTGDPMCISTQSWWACVNYFLSVLPFLSAVQQGFMGEAVLVKMKVPAGGEDYCTTYADCLALYPEQMASWDAFYQSNYSSPEVAFANSWLDSAQYVAATHFQSNIERTLMFMTPLPSRVLKKGDRAPYIADLSKEENHTLSTFSWMKSINSLLGGTLTRLWRRAMCSASTRERGRALMEQLLLEQGFAATTFLSIIAKMSSSC
ncbi:protein LEG1 homolog [Diretmus argenteus]